MIILEKLVNYIKKYPWIDFLILGIILITFALLFGNHVSLPFTDRGRELFLSEQIMYGAVPYKDITLIYFPFAYYINALLFKIFGNSLDTLFISQIILSFGMICLFYNLAKDFLSRKLSFVLTFFILASCIFSINDLFGMMNPYSYAMVYGIAAFWLCIFSLVKLFKTDNIKFAYLAGLAGGFSASCKLEFITVIFLLIAGFLLYKRLKFNQYLKILLSFCVFPFLVISILIIQGITIKNITDAIVFAKNFSSSNAMKDFLGLMGLYPISHINDLAILVNYTLKFVLMILSCIFTLFLHKKYKQIYILPIATILICAYFGSTEQLYSNWLFLPIFVFLLSCTFFKQLKNEDKSILLILICAILLSQRVFFWLSLRLYGVFALPFLILGLNMLIEKFAPKNIFNIKTENIIIYVFSILIISHTIGQYSHRIQTNYPIFSEKGIMYTDEGTAYTINTTLDYIKFSTNKNDKILVLQEGNIINYMGDRKVDLHCFIMDILYYEAYKPKKAIEIVKQTKSDYIIIVNFGIPYFNRPFLYEKDSNMLIGYIYKNYTPVLGILKNQLQVTKNINLIKDDGHYGLIILKKNKIKS